MEEYKYIEFKERVAAGLRAVADIGAPIALVCANDFEPDFQVCCGLEILSMGTLLHTPYRDFNCPVFPLFKAYPAISKERLRMADYSFARAFMEAKTVCDLEHSQVKAINPHLSRCLKCGGFLVVILAFVGCGMSNDDIIRETNKCRSAGMDTYEVINAFTYKTTDIICKPCEEEKAAPVQQTTNAINK